MQDGRRISQSDAVGALFHNESMDRPVLYRGRVLRSLWYYGFNAAERNESWVGYFLFALCLRLSLE
jgi:hypothetical protein